MAEGEKGPTADNPPSSSEEQPFPARPGERWSHYMARYERWLASGKQISPEEAAEIAHEKKVGAMNELIDNAFQMGKTTPTSPSKGLNPNTPKPSK